MRNFLIAVNLVICIFIASCSDNPVEDANVTISETETSALTKLPYDLTDLNLSDAETVARIYLSDKKTRSNHVNKTIKNTSIIYGENNRRFC